MADPQFLTVPHLDRRTIARFFSKLHVDPETGCWVWDAALVTYGYGVFWFRGKNELAHRVLYAWLVEPLPRGLGVGILMLDHIVCDRPACCNPTHLRLVPGVENLRRTNSVSAVNRRKTHCKRGHSLPSGPNRYNGYGRVCKVCAKITSAARLATQRLANMEANRQAREARIANREKTREFRKEKAREYAHEYNIANREKLRAYHREYYRRTHSKTFRA